jgi:hypothetical protein
MTRFGLAALLLVVAGQASALSCIPPDVARDYQRVDAADAQYFPVAGTLSFDPSSLPTGDFDNQGATPQETDIQANFTGNALSAEGFTTPFETDITLRVKCFGPWCASPKTDTQYLSFFESTEDGLVMHVDPCGSMSYPNPTPEMLARVLACTTGDCPIDESAEP